MGMLGQAGIFPSLNFSSVSRIKAVEFGDANQCLNDDGTLAGVIGNGE